MSGGWFFRPLGSSGLALPWLGESYVGVIIWRVLGRVFVILLVFGGVIELKLVTAQDDRRPSSRVIPGGPLRELGGARAWAVKVAYQAPISVFLTGWKRGAFKCRGPLTHI